MFAFCPMISQKNCGISNSDSTDMKIIASEEIKTISTNELGYKHGRPDEREYDACYYEILPQKEDKSIGIEITVEKASNVNVYAYSGKSRVEAKEELVKDNESPKLD